MLVQESSTPLPKLQIPTPITQTQVDTFVNANLAKIQQVQEDYLTANGHYWQGIATPQVVPSNVTLTTPDLTLKPTDQSSRWADVFSGAKALPNKWPAQIRIDVYDGPLGKGWTLTITVNDSNGTSFKVWNFGPETWRAQDWLDLVVGNITQSQLAPSQSLFARVWNNIKSFFTA